MKLLAQKYLSLKLCSISMGYFILIIISSIFSASNTVSHSLFDYISNLRSGGSASNFVLIVGVLPILALNFPLLMDRLENSVVVTRMGNKLKLLYEQGILLFIVSFFLTIIMCVSGVLASLFINGHTHNYWGTKSGSIYFLLENKSLFPVYIPHVTSAKVWFYIIFSRYLAIVFMGASIILLKLLLNKNIYVFFSALIIFGTDSFILGDLSVFLGRAQIKMDTWISPGEQWFNLIYFILGILVAFIFSGKLYEKKEFY